MRLYSYVVRYDVGFAPNPFQGWCTLATCKPEIRRAAGPGDWIVGTGSKSNGAEGRLVYAMRIAEVLTFQQYWDDPRFAVKKPVRTASVKRAYGDNVYHRAEDGAWLQEDSRHSFADGTSNRGHVERDTSADAVLVASEFAYFGPTGPRVPARLRSEELDLVHHGRSHRCNFPNKVRDEAVEWIRSLPQGVHADPRDW